MTRKTLNLVPLATRSLRTILEVADHVSNRRLRPEVAATVKGLFDLLAWSDGRLDHAEMALLESLCVEVPSFGQLCAMADDYRPSDPTFAETPALLSAVVEHDRATGERLTPIMVAALETLGHAVIGAGGAPLDVEKSELYTYVDGLRGLSRVLAAAERASDGP